MRRPIVLMLGLIALCVPSFVLYVLAWLGGMLLQADSGIASGARRA